MERRELIRSMHRFGITQASIARKIGRHPTSVCNALKGRFKSRPILAACEAAIAEASKGEFDVQDPDRPAQGPGPPG